MYGPTGDEQHLSNRLLLSDARLDKPALRGRMIS